MLLELPRYSASFTVKVGNQPAQVFTYEGPVPERVMDAYRQVVGDGLAKITVSVDFGMKDYGAGVSSMASVTLSCGQTEQEIRRASELAGELAREFAHQNALQANSQLNELKAQMSGAVAGSPFIPRR